MHAVTGAQTGEVYGLAVASFGYLWWRLRGSQFALALPLVGLQAVFLLQAFAVALEDGFKVAPAWHFALTGWVVGVELTMMVLATAVVSYAWSPIVPERFRGEGWEKRMLVRSRRNAWGFSLFYGEVVVTAFGTGHTSSWVPWAAVGSISYVWAWDRVQHRGGLERLGAWIEGSPRRIALSIGVLTNASAAVLPAVLLFYRPEQVDSFGPRLGVYLTARQDLVLGVLLGVAGIVITILVGFTFARLSIAESREQQERFLSQQLAIVKYAVLPLLVVWPLLDALAPPRPYFAIGVLVAIPMAVRLLWPGPVDSQATTAPS